MTRTLIKFICPITEPKPCPPCKLNSTPKQPLTSGKIVTSINRNSSEPSHINALCHSRNRYGASGGKIDNPAEVKSPTVSSRASNGGNQPVSTNGRQPNTPSNGYISKIAVADDANGAR